jgi:TRAP-type mannitol/chloroaromatic compound transport system substrate-binding protein
LPLGIAKQLDEMVGGQFEIQTFSA